KACVPPTATPTATPTSTPTPTITATPTQTNTPVDGEGCTECAIEGQVCTIPAPKYVRYGALGRFNDAHFNPPTVACNNTTFGDPNSGVAKKCYYCDQPLPTKTPTQSPTSTFTLTATPTL